MLSWGHATSIEATVLSKNLEKSLRFSGAAKVTLVEYDTTNYCECYYVSRSLNVQDMTFRQNLSVGMESWADFKKSARFGQVRAIRTHLFGGPSEMATTPSTNDETVQVPTALMHRSMGQFDKNALRRSVLVWRRHMRVRVWQPDRFVKKLLELYRYADSVAELVVHIGKLNKRLPTYVLPSSTIPVIELRQKKDASLPAFDNENRDDITALDDMWRDW
uniref:Uncharacterized protein n=1 Tax=Globodera rostochiensis TaxID=31243 RepID=A0A914HQL0_GLORO